MGRCEKELFRVVDRELAGPREKYAMYMNEPDLLYEALENGAENKTRYCEGKFSGN